MTRQFEKLAHSLYECKYHRVNWLRNYSTGFPNCEKNTGGQHVWSRGYCVSTVGLDEERIKKYVKWQRSKDKDADVVTHQGKLFS